MPVLLLAPLRACFFPKLEADQWAEAHIKLEPPLLPPAREVGPDDSTCSARDFMKAMAFVTSPRPPSRP